MPADDPFDAFRRWLQWLDSHDGRLDRRRRGMQEDDYDLICLIPTPPSSTIFTVGDLRRLVTAGNRLAGLTGGDHVK